MRLTEFARKLGVSSDTVRRLERRRLVIPARDWNGHRRFTEADLERVRAALFRDRPPDSGARLGVEDHGE